MGRTVPRVRDCRDGNAWGETSGVDMDGAAWRNWP